MASKKKKKLEKKKSPLAEPQKIVADLGFWGQTELHYLLVFLVAVFLYGNTLTHEYTQDDAIVIYDNMYTTQGIQGIPGLLTKDTFFGFFKEEGKANLVSGGRYRPFTPVMFAVGWQIFGKSPFIGHLMNILWYGLLGIILYMVLSRMLIPKKATQANKMLVLLATLLFIAHPIHTEVVANIKGRDEIMALLGSLLAMLWVFKNPVKNKILSGFLIGVVFFLALMSKENTITFLAVIPLALFLFRNISIGAIAKKMVPVVTATIAFLICRTSVLGFDLGGKPMELMNNPYLKVQGNGYVDFSVGEKFGTIFYTLGKYLELLIAPVTLTHDYYPYHIPIMSFENWQVWLSVIAYVTLLFFAIYRYGKKSIPTFCILYFIITLSIVSNLVFPIGTNMSERFMFMPSVGFALLLSILLVKYVFKKYGMIPFAALSLVILSLYSVKTVTRNMVWENDFTLFQTDVETSINSAKIQNAAGGSLITKSEKENNQVVKIQMVDKAITHLTKAISIHPNYRNAYLLLGNAYYYKSNYQKAIEQYNQVLRLNPGNRDGTNNLAVALRDQGRFYGEKQSNLSKALEYLNRSYEVNPNDKETIRLLGVTYGMGGQHANALPYFKKLVETNPNEVSFVKNLSLAYRNTGDMENADIYQKKALQLDPNAFN